MLAAHLIGYSRATGVGVAFRLPPQVLGVSYAAMLTLVFVLDSRVGAKVFIYFQF